MSAAIVLRADAKKTEAWIAAVAKTNDVQRWKLLQMAGRSASIVATFTAGELEADGSAAIAARVHERAQRDADDTGAGRTCSYALAAYDLEDQAVERFTFRVTGRPGGPSEAGPEEEPTVIGLVGQRMRHDEAIARLRYGTAIEVAEAYRAVVGDLRGILREVREDTTALRTQLSARDERVRTLEGRLDGLHDERAEIAERRAKHELELRREEASAARTAKLIKMATTFLPMLLRQRGTDTGFDSELAAFVMTLEPEQLPKIAAALTEAQQVTLIALIKKYVPDPEAAEKAPGRAN